jgi:hypothetical protein
MVEHGIFSNPGTWLGTATTPFSRSHPRTYHRKSAKTIGGILVLVAKDTKGDGLIYGYSGCQIPFIPRNRRASGKSKIFRHGPGRWAGRIVAWIYWRLILILQRWYRHGNFEGFQTEEPRELKSQSAPLMA